MVDQLQGRSPASCLSQGRRSSSAKYSLTMSKSRGSFRDSVAALNRSAAALGFEKSTIDCLPLRDRLATNFSMINAQQWLRKPKLRSLIKEPGNCWSPRACGRKTGNGWTEPCP